VRNILLGFIMTTVAASCAAADSQPLSRPAAQIQIHPTGSPYVQVDAGEVHALVPHGWQAVLANADGVREGFVASPSPSAWEAFDGETFGMAATWIDATEVGVPSDFYYLAATGPLLSWLTTMPGCMMEQHRVFADHVPSFVTSAAEGSAGDYVARGEGVCVLANRPDTRWSFFVAAPGFGPARSVGIPSSGLYLVVAMTRESPRAHRILDRLLSSIRFGSAGIVDFTRAVLHPTV
jgi:hypothetical protein